MTKQTRKSVDIPMLVLRAAFVPASANEETRTVDMVWSTGAKVLRRPWFDEPYFEELSLEEKAVRLGRLNNGAPLLNSHRNYDLSHVIGVVEEASVDGKEGRATVRFSDREEVAPIFRDVVNGILRNISVGYNVYRYEEVQQDDDKMKTLRAVDWEPLELSVVPIGADDGAGFRSEDSTTHPCTITRALGAQATEEETGMTVKTDKTPKGDEQEQQRAGDIDTTVPAGSVQTVDEDKVRAEAAKAERKRASDIRSAVRTAKLDDKFADDLVERGVTIDQAREAIFNKMAEREEGAETRTQHGGHLQLGDEDNEKFVRGAGLALCARAGLEKDETDNEFRGLTLRELARESLRIRGVSTRGMSAMEMIGRAFTHSGGDFSNIVSNVANKSMLKGYEESGETFQAWTATGNLTDFKPASRIDLNAFPSLREVRPGAEYKYATVGDRGETIQLATYGELFSVNRQTIINDDLDAFSRVPRRMGRAAIRTVGDLVYAILTGNPAMSDGTALFHADHANLLSSLAITTSSIDAMMAAMAKQKDRDSNATALNIMLKYLLVPVALRGTALTVRDSEKEITASGRTNTTPNWVAGTFDVIADARLDAASTSNWFGAADPAMTDTIEVAYLDGMQSPMLEQREGWSVDGVEFKVRIDAGVKALAWEGLAKNPN